MTNGVVCIDINKQNYALQTKGQNETKQIYYENIMKMRY